MIKQAIVTGPVAPLDKLEKKISGLTEDYLGIVNNVKREGDTSLTLYLIEGLARDDAEGIIEEALGAIEGLKVSFD